MDNGDSGAVGTPAELESLVLKSKCKEGERVALLKVLGDFQEIFTKRPGETSIVEHAIETGDAKPIFVYPRPASKRKREELDKAFDELLDLDLIEPSNSPWAAPPVLVGKPDGSKRLCIDFKELNRVTVDDRYNMPSIPNILAYLGNAKYFTTFDLSKGFYQVSVRECDKPKTAFVCHRGLFQFKKMPFRLKNGPSTFMRLVDKVLAPYKWKFVLGFYDDFTVYSDSFEDHLIHIRQVLERVAEAGLTINSSKVQLCAGEVSLLGYKVGPGYCKPNPEKFQAIEDFPQPKNVTELQRFLGMIGYYRQFIPDIAGTARPLYDLLKKNTKWCWEESHSNAMRELIKQVKNTAELALPDLNGKFLIRCDASLRGLGAVLEQEGEKGMTPIAFISRGLAPAERNYSTTELECLAVVFALKKFRMYVEGTDFVIETDHQALKWLRHLKEPAGRLARWALELQPYNFEVRYRPGKLNVVADALSRAPFDTEEGRGEAEVTLVVSKEFSSESTGEENSSKEWGLPFDRKAIISSQVTDLGLARIFAELERVRSSVSPDTALEAGAVLDQYIVDEDGLLFRYFAPWDEDDEDGLENAWKVVVPKSLRVPFIKYFHDEAIAGHQGACKTFKRLKSRVTWSGMKRDVIKYVRGCEVCQKSKPSQQLTPGLLSSVRSERPFELVTADLMGPYTRSAKGNQYLLVIVDHFTKWTELFPLRKMTTEKIWEKMYEVFARNGFPRQVITDNASVFSSKKFKSACAELGIRPKTTSPYHAQANLTERMNRTIKPMIISYVERHKDWDARLPELGFALRSGESQSTGYSPAALNLGRELSAPLDWELLPGNSSGNRGVASYAEKLKIRLHDAIDHARLNLQDSKLTQKLHYDKRHRAVFYNRGDLVLRKTHLLSDASRGITASLGDKFEGPFVVQERTTPLTYRLGDPNSGVFIGVTHVSQLRPFTPPWRGDDVSPTEKASDPAVLKEKSLSQAKRKRRRRWSLVNPPANPYNLRSKAVA